MKETINTFVGGLNKDVDPKIIGSNQYIDAENITITSFGEAGSVNQMPGSLYINKIAPNSSNIQCVNVSYTKIKTNEGQKDGLVLFYFYVDSGGNLNFLVLCGLLTEDSSKFNDVVEEHKSTVRTLTNVRSLYLKNYGNYLSSKEEFDNKYLKGNVFTQEFQELNSPVLYFNDQYSPLKKLICDISSENLPNLPYSDDEVIAVPSNITSPPKYNVVKDDVESKSGIDISSFGACFSGAYFVSSRLVNSKLNKQTKWSLFNGPITISNDIHAFVNGGRVGEVSNKKLVFFSDLSGMSQNEISSYDKVQFAVIEKIDGDGTPSGLAKITPLIDLKDPSQGLSGTGYDNSNFESEVAISEIVVDDAQVVAFKDFIIKDNRIIKGGLTYADLSIDSEPVATFSPVRREVYIASNMSYFREELNSLSGTNFHKRRSGYFRNELYRFGVVYHDKYGNWAPVHWLADVKTPDISRAPIFNENGIPNAINIAINGFTNHPSWATGFAIVRAKRKKDILFQTPLISSVYIASPYATENYPQNSRINPDPNAQIGNVLGTVVPKDLTTLYPKSYIHSNYFYSTGLYPGVIPYYSQNDVQFFEPSADGRINQKRKVESPVSACKYIHNVFNSNNLYNFNSALFEPYTYSSGDKIEAVDVAYVVSRNKRFSGSDYIAGTDPHASEYFAWVDTPRFRYAHQVSNSKYPYLDLISDSSIIEYQDISYSQDRAVLTKSPGDLIASTYCNYEGIDSTLGEGRTPVNQKSSVIITQDPVSDPVYDFTTTYRPDIASESSIKFRFGGVAGINNAPVSSDIYQNPVPSGLRLPTETLSESINLVCRNGTLYTQNAVLIVNIKKGLSDNRYGDPESKHEYVFCGEGAYSKISDKNQVFNLEIGGGDCYLSLHTFKISDSSYAGAGAANDLRENGNQLGTQDAIDKYGNSFRENFFASSLSSADAEFNRPIPQRAKGQTISLFLESEIDASRGYPSEYSQIVKYREINVPVPSGSGQVRSAFNYEYNLGYSLPNNFKVFFPRDNDLKENNNFLSRLIFSDPVIYNSRDNGISRFRVGNITDLNEAGGVLSKLVTAGDRLIALQERNVTYIPVQSNIVEQSNANTISIRTDDFLGNPIVISSSSGCKHGKTVAKDSYGFYFMDFFNKNIMYYSSEGLKNISDGISGLLNSKLNNTKLIEHAQIGFYDFKEDKYIYLSPAGSSNEEYPVSDGYVPFAASFSKRIDGWESTINLGGELIQGNIDVKVEKPQACYTPYGVYLVSKNNVYQHGISKLCRFMGIQVPPSISFSVNESITDSKVFDVLTINSDFKPFKIEVFEKSIFDKNLFKVNGSSYAEMDELDIYEREDSFRCPIKRVVGNGDRIRGKLAIVKVTMTPFLTNESGEDQRIGMISAVTKYRSSAKAR